MKPKKNFFIMSKLIAALLCALLFSSTAFAASSLVIIGDSISSGYGLEGYSATKKNEVKGSYPNLLAAKKGYTVFNYAVDGTATDAILKQVTEMAEKSPSDWEKVKQGDIISITAGGNDMLRMLIGSIGNAYGLDVSAKPGFVEILKVTGTLSESLEKSKAAAMIRTLLAAKDMQNTISDKCDEYGNELEKLISTLKEANPDAIYVVQTLYNPYSDMTEIPGLPSMLDSLVKNLNNKIYELSDNGSNFIVADVYTAFRKSHDSLIGAVNGIRFDPHPNKNGHALIAETVQKAIENANQR